MAKAAAKAAADLAMAKALKEAATAAATKAAKEAATAAATKAAKEAATAAATKAAKEAASAAAAKAAKEAATEAATAAATTAAKEAATAAATKAAKEAATAAASKAAKEAAQEAAKKTVKETLQSAASKSAKFAAKNPGLVIGGLTAAAAAGVALDRFNKKDGAKMSITAIEQDGKDSAAVKITFSPPMDITATDKVTVFGSDCAPSVDGEQIPVAKVLSSTSIVIPGGTLSSAGKKGTLTLHTSFDGQVLGLMEDAAKTAANTTATIMGGVVDAGLQGAGLPSLNDLGDTLAGYKYYLMTAGALAAVLAAVYVYRTLFPQRAQPVYAQPLAPATLP
ncbi:hypothetical protein JKP88DRAFT_272818 [Tribonema minus]|uniref:Uncharacterized protein n=1 Tax=Tribonema minus TaxID=303371 RepID=A0A835YXW3_9STRA|nr:hypothetical protein JKP88DRAFT_272818 [Tribonema minus]